MESVRIWLNRNYATTVHVLDMLRRNEDGVPVTLFVSHADPSSPMLTGGDHRLHEPVVTEPDFVDQMVLMCRRHQIDVLLPGAGQSLVAHRADEFKAIDTALICPSGRVVDLLSDKAATYRALRGSELVPPWRAVCTSAEFETAVEDLDHLWTARHPLVLKPAVGVGADGVRFLSRTGPDLADLLGPVGPLVGIDVVRRAMAEAEAAGAAIPPLMVMPYLSGPETSIDILARGGRTLAAVPRTKNGRHRVIGGHPALPGLATELVEHFDLDGLVNVQFRWFDDRPALLEINPRPSGGLHQTALAGVNLPWAAVQLALGQDPGCLRPVLGAEYVTVSDVIPMTHPVAGSSVTTGRPDRLSGLAAHPVDDVLDEGVHRSQCLEVGPVVGVRSGEVGCGPFDTGGLGVQHRAPLRHQSPVDHEQLGIAQLEPGGFCGGHRVGPGVAQNS